MANSFQKYYGSNKAAKVIYGAILIFVFLIGLEHTGGDNPALLAIKTFLAALTIVFAETYSEIIGFTIKNKRALNKPERLEVIQDSMAIASVSFWPSLLLLISGTHLYALETGFFLAFIYCLALIFIFCYWAIRLSNFSRFKAFLVAILTSGVGVFIIAIKYFANH